jgi:hypothetical protein
MDFFYSFVRHGAPRLLTFFLLLLLAFAVSCWPAVLLLLREKTYHWRTRYFFAAYPALFSGLCWALTSVFLEVYGCSGNFKRLDCAEHIPLFASYVLGFLFDQMLVFYLVAFPLSFFLVVKTIAKHFEAWAASKD